MVEQEQRFEQWCIVELFGHQKLAGVVSEAQIGGCSFIRVDVPEMHGQPAFTRFYGEKAIYSITPVSEEVARAAMDYLRVRPVATYMLPSPEPTSTSAVPRESVEPGIIGDEIDSIDPWDDEEEDPEEGGVPF
jgi:hypothetical protein